VRSRNSPGQRFDMFVSHETQRGPLSAVWVMDVEAVAVPLNQTLGTRRLAFGPVVRAWSLRSLDKPVLRSTRRNDARA